MFGGGLWLAFSTATVSNSTFLKNSAGSGGATSVMKNSSLVISHSYFSENSATPAVIVCPWCGLGLLSNKVPILTSTAS